MQYAKQHAAPFVTASGIGRGAPGVAVPSASATTGAGSDYSTTNVQEPGVDEPDPVKTNGSTLFAYYNTNGDLQAVVRNITSDQLPISLLSEMKKDYSDFWITDLFEIASDVQSNYYVTLENSDKKIVLIRTSYG